MLLNLVFFFSELFSFLVLFFSHSFFTEMANVEISETLEIAGAFFSIVILEVWLIRWISLDEKIGKSVRVVLLSHIPSLLTWLYPFVLGLNLPEPHNFNLRKIQILLGVILAAHFFIFARCLLSVSYKKKLKHSKIFGFVAIVFFVGITCWTGAVCGLSGDEPHYLLMAHSLIHDGDLDLANNYQNKDYQSFYHRGDLEPQALEHVVDGKRYSHHPLGPVLLVLPGFALLGRIGAALTISLLAALALFLTLRVMEETGAEGWALHATGIIGLFSSPLLLFSGLIYPEIPTACLVALSLLFYIRKRWGWFGLCQGFLLWMHNRNVLLVLPFLVFAGYEIFKNKKTAWNGTGKAAVGLGIPVLLLSFYFYSIYGVFTPLGAHNEPFTSLFRLSHFGAGFLGLVLDQECGLWFHFPVFALMILGGFVLYQSRNPLRFLVLGVFSFYYLFMSFYENLGLTPATRYMVGVTPLLLFMLYPAIEKIQKRPLGMKLGGLLLAVGVFVNWILAAIPWMRYNKMDGENWMLKIAGGFLHLPLTSFWPSFNPPVIQPQSYFIGIFWMGLVFGLTALFLKEKKTKNS